MKTKKSSKPAASKPTAPNKVPSIGPLIDRLQATVPDGRVAFLETAGAKLVVQIADYYGLSTSGKIGATIKRVVEHVEKIDQQAANASERAGEETHQAGTDAANDARDGAPVGNEAPTAAPPSAGANVGEPGANDAPTVEPPAASTEAPKPGRRRAEPKPPKEPKPRDERLPPPGTTFEKLDRHGTVRCSCTVEERGIRYKETLYKTLSAAAMAAAKDLGLGSKALNGWAWWGITKPVARAAKKDVVEALSHAWDKYLVAMGKLVDGASDDDRAKLRATICNQVATLQVHATDPAA